MRQQPTDPKSILGIAENQEQYTLTLHEPSRDLAHFVETYWIARWDVAEGKTFTTEMLPFPSVSIAISQDISEIIGIVTAKTTSAISGNGVVLGVKFRPGGFYPFYKKPVDRLTNQTAPLASLWSVTRIKKVIGALEAGDTQLIEEIEKLLRAKRPEHDPTVDGVNDILTAIRTDKELNSIQAVSEKFSISERTLQHAFQRYVGIGVKWIIGRYRLQDIADAINHGATDWAQLAQDYGFADQAHFIHDFEKIIGETPAQYSKRLAD